MAASNTPIYFKKYNKKEAIVMSKITEFKLSHAFTPLIRNEKTKIALSKNAYMEQIAKEKNVSLAELWKIMKYQDFLQQFASQVSLDERGFGRNEIYQYYSQKQILEQELINLIKSPRHSFEDEIRLRTQIYNLRVDFLKHFQDKYDAYTNPETGNNVFTQTLQKLEALRQQVAQDENSMTNEGLLMYLESLFETYKPQNVSRKNADSYLELFRIAIKS